MLLRSKYCTKPQCCCIWLTCKTFQRDVSFKIYKGLLHMNDYYICVRRFVVSDPELPDSLYIQNKSSPKDGFRVTLFSLSTGYWYLCTGMVMHVLRFYLNFFINSLYNCILNEKSALFFITRTAISRRFDQ